MNNLSFSSACAPTFLPVNENNEIYFDVIEKYFNYLYDNGIRTLFVNGGCGEFSSLTVNERKKVLEKWIEVAKDDVQIVVNIGTSNMADTIELGNHALSFSRLYGIAIVPPFYMSIKNEEVLLNYLMCVANALSREIPILYYHIPSLSKVNININTFLNLVKERQFNQLGAVKCTDANLDSFIDFLNGINSNNLNINVYCGYELSLIESINSGAKGAILGFVNIFPQLINNVIRSPLSESNLDDIKKLKSLFSETVQFSEENKVDIVGLLKACTEFFSNIKLGSMKKPYNIPEEIISKYQTILKKFSN